MGKLVEQIESLGYHFQEGKQLLSVAAQQGFTEIRQLLVRSMDGQTIVVKQDDSLMLFPGGIAFSKGVLDVSLADGVRTTCAEIYRDYYNLDENGYSMLLYNYSGRTKQYLDAEKQRIGLTDYKDGLPEGFFAVGHYDELGYGVAEMDIGRYADRALCRAERAGRDGRRACAAHALFAPAQPPGRHGRAGHSQAGTRL